MDICELTDTQFYTLRETRSEEAIAILEIPKTACLSGDRQAEITKLMRYDLDERYSFMIWEGGDDVGKVEIRFQFYENQCSQNAPPSSVPCLLCDGLVMTFDPISRHDAINALLLGRLDYFRATSSSKVSRDFHANLELEYVGKLEVDGEFPRLIRHLPEVAAPAETLKALPKPESIA